MALETTIRIDALHTTRARAQIAALDRVITSGRAVAEAGARLTALIPGTVNPVVLDRRHFADLEAALELYAQATTEYAAATDEETPDADTNA